VSWTIGIRPEESSPRKQEVINRMRSFRDPVLDAGMKFAFENHAGDMRTDELLELIDATGSDICGAFYDPGNAVYAMEDPEVAIENHWPAYHLLPGP
jgi:3-oxoisoapionate decarboxylase